MFVDFMENTSFSHWTVFYVEAMKKSLNLFVTSLYFLLNTLKCIYYEERERNYFENFNRILF